MSNETAFKVDVPGTEVASLKQKLGLTRLPDELDDAGWKYGVPLAEVRRLVSRWQNGYDWRTQEAEINKLPQYTRDIEVQGFETLKIHYVHQKSGAKNAIPLLFVHGWPGHFLEVKKILPLLTEGSPSFHVVALSLPGYGFSQAPKNQGFGLPQYAEVCHKLMLSLDYPEYVTQGGDWGHMITRTIAHKYGPKHVKAWHTNMIIEGPPRLKSNPLLWLQHAIMPYSAREVESLKRTAWFRTLGHGYLTLQSTQPQTVGYSLTDSPIGLLAWIYEKLVTWTDSYPWTDDEVLDWVSLYWFSTAGPAASVRIYYEVTQSGQFNLPQITRVPTGISYFPKDLANGPKTWARTLGWVVFESEHTRGGHFAAHEQPEALVNDLRAMFGRKGPAYCVVKGKSGYDESRDARL